MPEEKERLLDRPEVYERLREEANKTRKNQVELSEHLGISRPYLVKLINGKAAISGSAIKAFITGGIDVQYIFSGQSDREEIKRLQAEIRTLKDLIREAYSSNNN